MRSFLIIYCFFFTLLSMAQTAVDLGLSVRWADCNLGAEKPEDYGGLYGWADPTGECTDTLPPSLHHRLYRHHRPKPDEAKGFLMQNNV